MTTVTLVSTLPPQQRMPLPLVLQRLGTKERTFPTTVTASMYSLQVCFRIMHSRFMCLSTFNLSGLNILSTYKGSRHATSTLSGTSMASPHTAGLLAYLLSLYPSEEFDPLLDEDLIPSTLQNQHTFSTLSLTSIYSIAHASLPGFITEYLPSPKLLEAITAESQGPSTLTPLQLKKALLALSSKGVLSDLPEKTPNLLIFNNATS